MSKRTKADSPTKDCGKPGCTKPLRARGLCSTHYNLTHQPNRHARQVTSCTVCGAEIMRTFRTDRRPVCSSECRTILSGQTPGTGYDWATHAVVRAREAGAVVVETFDRIEIFERDDWTCYLCGTRVDWAAGLFEPDYPTVDHVKPLSQGGEHSRANARTACFACNSARLNFEPTPATA